MSRLVINDWLLTECIRHAEERTGRLPDTAALAIARDRGTGLPGRICTRASALEAAPAVRADIARLRGALAWLGSAAGLLGLLVGGLAARAVIADRQVDILLAAAALLLVPTLVLLAWIGAMLLAAFRGGSGSLGGGVILAGMRWLGPRLLASRYAADVMTAFGQAAMTVWGRWRLSAIAHGFWLAYALGALATLLVYFSFVQYELSWGTTLLSDQTVVGLVKHLAVWPEWLGFMPPASEDWIIAGREGVAKAPARADWAHFLLAMIAAWAIVPRALLLALSAGLSILAGRRMRLDTTQPGYLRLAADLVPATGRREQTDRPLPPVARRHRRRTRPDARGILGVAIELEDPDGRSAGRIPGIELIDLGRADHRAARQAALETVRELRRPAAAVLGVCSMLRTPDAGTERFLSGLADAASAPLWLLLDEGGMLEARGGDIAQRRADWQALAERAGAQIVFVDRDRPDAAELARLHRGLVLQET
ncbi:MAG: DUF2868 domain-containing protein [Pseudomonadota bacterium]|nr:MAG: DUF2868 domain-containing protein [Pseudomonadota bacterium]